MLTLTIFLALIKIKIANVFKLGSDTAVNNIKTHSSYI